MHELAEHDGWALNTIPHFRADVEILRAARSAMDIHDAATGNETLLSTEGFGDLCNLHAGAALVAWVG